MGVQGASGAIFPSMTAVASLTELDPRTISLVRLAARVTAGSETEMRTGFAECRAAGVDSVWVEELVLQSYLFAGFPRALNAASVMRGEEAKRQGGKEAEGLRPETRDGQGQIDEWRRRGEETCATVYGPMYEKLRGNIRALHPALDEWMIVEGYGKVLSRPGLDLRRRELCIVAACAAAGQDRQLHSHLHGARNAGVANAVIEESLAALEGVVNAEFLKNAQMLWARVRGK
jgi:4-carboxymuconolactone decarboxylase